METRKMDDCRLVILAHDNLRSGDFANARYWLSLISDDFYDSQAVKLALEDEDFAEMIADLVEGFCVTDFRSLKDRGVKA